MISIYNGTIIKATRLMSNKTKNIAKELRQINIIKTMIKEKLAAKQDKHGIFN